MGCGIFGLKLQGYQKVFSSLSLHSSKRNIPLLDAVNYPYHFYLDSYECKFLQPIVA
nr:MAG TPA: hypothetical protein [Caudoviricetes sp.]DAY77784.1 MAG TPA: hypothetical protein [Caudoviricetes sp.]